MKRSSNQSDHIRPSPRAVAPTEDSLSRPSSVKGSGGVVGIVISGILYKWVNYGKGWRPRWFVLQDGVLSFYKIHGPDKVIVPPQEEEVEDIQMVIGEESEKSPCPSRRISRHMNGSFQFPRQTVGEVHLKVSTIRESRSDHKRFSIFTGTKRLHLRAETREDRGTWIKCLQAAKEMFPRMSNSELMAPLDNVVVSTEKLRQRLTEEGVTEAAIQDTEQIMRTEFSVLLSQLTRLKDKHLQLIDTLRQLEVRITASRKQQHNASSSATSQVCHSLENNSAPSSTFHSPRNSFSGLHL